jgi:hypothetical protein
MSLLRRRRQINKLPLPGQYLPGCNLQEPCDAPGGGAFTWQDLGQQAFQQRHEHVAWL